MIAGGILALGVLLASPALAQDKKDAPADKAAKQSDKPAAKPAAPKDDKAAPKPAGKDDHAGKPDPAAAGKAGKQAGGESSLEMQAAMAAAMPGPVHKQLAKRAGEWTVASKLTMGTMPAEETAGTSKITLVLGGRFLHEEYSGTMMGMPFTSAKLLGYNNGSKKYEAVWTYTMGTNMMTMTGTSNDDGKTINWTASFDNEMGVKETLTIVSKTVDDDHFTVTMTGGKMPDGSDGPVMQMEYTRKK